MAGQIGILTVLTFTLIFVNLHPKSQSSFIVTNGQGLINPHGTQIIDSVNRKAIISWCSRTAILSLVTFKPIERIAGAKTKPAKLKLTRRHVNSSLYLSILLLLLAGDTHPNPGPIKYPCIECQKPVRSNQKGVYCDACCLWVHCKCIGMKSTTYQTLSQSDDLWSCPKCDTTPVAGAFDSTDTTPAASAFDSTDTTPVASAFDSTDTTLIDVTIIMP